MQRLILGTALFSWKMTAAQCHALLDAFYAKGGRWIDTAANYPINGSPHDHGAAGRILGDWIKAHAITDLKIIEKIGSMDNKGSPLNDLSPPALMRGLELSHQKFGENLDTIMIHWDNRLLDAPEVTSTVAALLSIRQSGVKVGLSGIKYPQNYQLLWAHEPILVEAKFHVFTTKPEAWQALHAPVSFAVYGISAGGLRFDGEYAENSSVALRNIEAAQFFPQLKMIRQELSDCGLAELIDTFYKFSLAYAFAHPDIAHVIVGPTSVQQWEEISQFSQLFDCRDALWLRFLSRIRRLSPARADGTSS